MPADLPIWWDQKFIELQGGSLVILEGTTSTVLPYSVSEDKFFVGYVGPYSAGFCDPKLHDSKELLRAAWTKLLNQNFSEGKIRLPPKSHFPGLLTLNLDTLTNLGFEIETRDLNFSINLKDYSEKKLNRNRRRELAKSKTLEMTFGSVEPEVAIETISRNRKHKGVQLSMDTTFAKKFMNTLPDKIEFFAVSHQDIFLAAATVIRVDNNLDYVFMWGHDQNEPNSGIALSRLAFELADRSKQRGAEILCLGTSSQDGVVDSGLAQFKTSLGAYSEERLTLSWARRQQT